MLSLRSNPSQHVSTIGAPASTAWSGSWCSAQHGRQAVAQRKATCLFAHGFARQHLILKPLVTHRLNPRLRLSTASQPPRCAPNLRRRRPAAATARTHANTHRETHTVTHAHTRTQSHTHQHAHTRARARACSIDILAYQHTDSSRVHRSRGRALPQPRAACLRSACPRSASPSHLASCCPPHSTLGAAARKDNACISAQRNAGRARTPRHAVIGC